MLVGFVGLIVLILLFGAAAVRDALARLLLFGAVLVGSIVAWAAISQTTSTGWVTLGVIVLLGGVLACFGYDFWARRADFAERRRSLENTWAFYETRGLFNDPAVREHATDLWGRGDRRALDDYCRSQLSDGVTHGASVKRVWSWFEEDIQARFDPEAKARARALLNSNDAHGLDRFCREVLARLADR